VCGLFGASLLALPACSLGQPRNEPMSTVLTLDVDVQLRAGELLVKYSVENTGDLTLYLLNRVPERSMTTSPDVVYIEFQRERRVVWLYKDIPAIPENVEPPMPIAPYVTAVRPHTRFEEVVHVPTPVREVLAYLPVPEEGHTATYGGLQLSIGYYWQVPGSREREIEVVPGVKALIPQPPPGTRTEVRTLVSRLVPLEIPVLEP
jgi:hypothetical protein